MYLCIFNTVDHSYVYCEVYSKINKIFYYSIIKIKIGLMA